jgi:hypothetical protein
MRLFVQSKQIMRQTGTPKTLIGVLGQGYSASTRVANLGGPSTDNLTLKSAVVSQFVTERFPYETQSPVRRPVF